MYLPLSNRAHKTYRKKEQPEQKTCILLAIHGHYQACRSPVLGCPGTLELRAGLETSPPGGGCVNLLCIFSTPRLPLAVGGAGRRRGVATSRRCDLQSPGLILDIHKIFLVMLLGFMAVQFFRR